MVGGAGWAQRKAARRRERFVLLGLVGLREGGGAKKGKNAFARACLATAARVAWREGRRRGGREDGAKTQRARPPPLKKENKERRGSPLTKP